MNERKKTVVKKIAIKRQIIKATDGILGTLTDFALFNLFFLGEYASSFDRRAIDKSISLAHEDLYKINYQKIRETLYNLKRKGFIKSLKLELYEEIITQKGKERIRAKLPEYQEKRPWDKRIYLISYDIPEKERNKRDILRHFLRKIGATCLQRSTWLSIYNPKQLIREFVEENNIPGQILVSDLGPDGSIGEENLKALVKRVYHLDEINEEYKIFLSEFGNYQKLAAFEKRKAVFTFFKILGQDPRLPFSLLPEDWKGEEVYLLYQKIMRLIYELPRA